MAFQKIIIVAFCTLLCSGSAKVDRFEELYCLAKTYTLKVEINQSLDVWQ